MIVLNKNQKTVFDYLINSGNDFLNDLVELEGVFESIPDNVANAFDSLSYKEKLEIIKKSASKLLSNITV